MALIRHTYLHRIRRDLETDLKSETSGAFKTALVSLAMGPLGMDVRHLKNAMSGLGTDEDSLDDILLWRTNADIKAIKAEYLQTYKQPLESAVKSDLSGKTQELFLMLLKASRPEPGTPFDPQTVDADVQRIHTATKARKGTDEIEVCAIFVACTEEKLLAIRDVYSRQYHASLADLIADEFSGHTKNALLAMPQRTEDPTREIASRLRPDMIAKIDRFIYWIVKLHWHPPLFEVVKRAFLDMYGMELRIRVVAPLQQADDAITAVTSDKYLVALMKRMVQ